MPSLSTHRYPGLFIALEGGDGAGKSTQSRLLAAWLRRRGLTVVETHEPGTSGLGGELRRLIKSDELDPSPRAEVLMFCADRAHHVARLIRPALARGQVVICDRYSDSTRAYQAGGGGHDPADINWLIDWSSGGLEPDLTIVLDTPVDHALSRVCARDGHLDRIEARTGGYHTRLRQAFLDLAAADPATHAVIGRDTIDHVHATITRTVTDRLASRLDQLTPPAHSAAS